MNLKELEARLQSLVEIDLLNVLPVKKVEDVVIQKLAAAIQQDTLTLEEASRKEPHIGPKGKILTGGFLLLAHLMALVIVLDLLKLRK